MRQPAEGTRSMVERREGLPKRRRTKALQRLRRSERFCRGARASPAERRDDVWSQNYQPVVQIFQQHPEAEPEREEIPADQPVQVVAAMRVTPGARPQSPSQRPSSCVFDEPETADIDRAAQ